MDVLDCNPYHLHYCLPGSGVGDGFDGKAYMAVDRHYLNLDDPDRLMEYNNSLDDTCLVYVS